MNHPSRFYRLVLIYTIWVCFWVFTRWISQDRFWLFAILNMVAEYYFVPLLVLLLIGLLRKDKQVLAWLAVPAVIFLSFWGQLYLPQLSPSEEDAMLTVMTYNVLVTNPNPQQVVKVVLDSSPDIVGFQELSRHNIPPLEAGLRDTYPYNTFDHFSGQRSDTGLVSRYPIVSVERFSFPPEERAMHTIVDWNGQLVHIFIVHLTANNLLQQSLAGAPALAMERFGHRAYQVQRIGEEVEEINEPTLVLCDCNFVDTSAAYAEMANLFTDSFMESGWGMGHTALFLNTTYPYQRIDYIWHSSEFTTGSSYVGNNLSSDHLPVVSSLIFSSPK